MQNDTESDYEYVDKPDDWDWENPIVVRGGRPPRHTFSVRFEASELDELREAAIGVNMKTGEFIRTAALAAARGRGSDGDPVKALIALAAEAGMRVSFEPAHPRADGEAPASAAS